MDLVDILLTVLRRWYLALLVAAVGIALSIYAASTLEPVYSVESQSLVVGPVKDTTGIISPEGPQEERVNPYTRFSGSLDVTAQAIIRVVDGSEFRSVLETEGLDGDYEFEAPPGAALILVTTEAPTPGGASALAKRVSQGLVVTLAGVQSEAGVPDDEQITLRNLTISEPEELSGSRQRVLIGGVVVSLILGAVVAVAADTVLDRRRRTVAKPGPGSQGTADPQGGSEAYRNETEPGANPSEHTDARDAPAPAADHTTELAEEVGSSSGTGDADEHSTLSR